MAEVPRSQRRAAPAPTQRRGARTDRSLALVLGSAFATLYGTSLCRTVYWNDSAELVAAAVTLGIPHPPGYPLYTLIGWLFTRLPVDPALAMNAMSACFSVLAVLLSQAVSRKLGASSFSAFFAAALFGLGAAFWKHSTIAEVYTPGIAFLLGALWLALHAVATRRLLPLCASGLVAGLGLGVHLSLATTGLAFVVLTLRSAPERATVREPRVVRVAPGLRAALPWALAAAASALLGACIFLYLPWRAASSPEMNFGDPRDAEAFWWMVTGGVYKSWFGTEQGFGWRLLSVVRVLGNQLTFASLLLAALGLWQLADRRGSAIALAWALGILGNVVYFFDYRVFDLEVFFLPACAMLASAAALGFDRALTWLGRALPRPWVLGSVKGAALLGLCLEAATSYADRDLSRNQSAFSYGQALVEQLPLSAILVTYTSPPEWRYYTVFRWYFQLVRRARPDVYVYVYPAKEFVEGLVADGYQVFAFSEVPLLDGFELRAEDRIAPDLVRVELRAETALERPSAVD